MRNKLKKVYTIILSLFALTTYADNQKLHIGHWDAEIEEMGLYQWQFTDAEIIITLQDFTVTNKYEIDYSKNPIRLDIIVENYPSLHSTISQDFGKVRCILEFINKNSFRISGDRFGSTNAPTSFDTAKDILVFHKKEEFIQQSP